MTTREALKQWAVTALVPLVTGTVVTWLVGNKVLAAVGITHSIVVSGLNSTLIFAVSTGVTWLAAHHILLGNYAPGAKAARAQARK